MKPRTRTGAGAAQAASNPFRIRRSGHILFSFPAPQPEHLMPQVNYVAVLAAAFAAFVLGSLWYSKALFATPWMAENMAMMEKNKANPPAIGPLLATAFLCALISAYAMAVLLVPLQHHSLEVGLRRGFAAGVCWVAASFASSYAFEGKTMRHWLINAGYYVVQFTLMGAILGLMNG
jgi:hypothetical protein